MRLTIYILHTSITVRLAFYVYQQERRQVILTKKLEDSNTIIAKYAVLLNEKNSALNIANENIALQKSYYFFAAEAGNSAINMLNSISPLIWAGAGVILAGVVIVCLNNNNLSTECAEKFANNAASCVEQSLTVVTEAIVKNNEQQTKLILEVMQDVNQINNTVWTKYVDLINNAIFKLQMALCGIVPNIGEKLSSNETVGLVSVQSADQATKIFENLFTQLNQVPLPSPETVVEIVTKL